MQARCKQCKKQANKEWALANPEKQLASVASWRKSNPEKMAEYSDKYRNAKRIANKKWHQKNPDKNREYLRARRARALGNNVIKYSEKDVIHTYGTICYICKIEINMNANRSIGSIGWEMALHIEHVIPISKGGPDTLENVRPSHGLCNLKKGAIEIDYISR